MSDGGNEMADMETDHPDSNKENQDAGVREDQPMDEDGPSDVKPPFQKLPPRARKLLKWIPPVKFFGMGVDGYYSIHIEHDCMIKTTRFIEKNIPGYKFHFVPFGQNNESIHLLHCPGGPLHGFPDHARQGTIGGIAALVDTSTEEADEMYALTANHVIEECEGCREYYSWTNGEEKSKVIIGTEVPYRIPLKIDSDIGTFENAEDDNTTASSTKRQRTYSGYYGKCQYQNWQGNDQELTEDENEEKINEFNSCKYEEQQQYDIACIKVDKEPKDIPAKFKPHFKACSKCCTDSCNEEIQVGLQVSSLGNDSSEPKSNGKILCTDAAGLIPYKGKTVWVSNMTVIGAKSASTKTKYCQKGDSGSIVVCNRKDGKNYDTCHQPTCFMVFAGWENISSHTKWGCSDVSLTFSLNEAIEKLKDQIYKKDKILKLSCCKNLSKLSYDEKMYQPKLDETLNETAPTSCLEHDQGETLNEPCLPSLPTGIIDTPKKQGSKSSSGMNQPCLSNAQGRSS